MFLFFIGLFVGSISMLVIMSLMFAAKRGDQVLSTHHLEYNKRLPKRS